MHLSLTRSLSLAFELEVPVDRSLSVPGRKTPPRTRSGTLMACGAVHTLLDVGTSACIADWRAARPALNFGLVGAWFLTVMLDTFGVTQLVNRGSGLFRQA